MDLEDGPRRAELRALKSPDDPGPSLGQKCLFPELGSQSIFFSCPSLLPRCLLAPWYSFGGQAGASFLPICLPPASWQAQGA